MVNQSKIKLKKKPTAYLKHATIIMIISTAIVSSLGSSVFAATSASAQILGKSVIFLIRNANSANFLATDLKKKKAYKINDRIEILSELTGISVDELKEKIQNGETTTDIAARLGVSEEYNSILTNAYNQGLDELYKCGRLSAEERDEMYNNADLTFINTGESALCDGERGIYSDNLQVASIISEVVGIDLYTAEKLLDMGEKPYDIAKMYGKASELKDYLFEGLIANIDKMLEKNEITEREADEMIADFENEFLKRCSLN